MPGIELKNITKTFGAATVIDNVSLSIRPHEFMVFLGPSGCGKSTLLRMIAGLESVDSGEIWIGERRVDRLAPGERRVAMVFQHYALYPHMTLRENMSFGLRNVKLAEAEISKRVDAAMIFVTHDQVEAMTLAHRIVVMNNRKIEQIGTPMEIYSRPATTFVAGRWKMLWHVTLPSIRRTFALVIIIEVVLQFQLFGQAYLMTQGGPNNASRPLVLFIFEVGFNRWDVGYAVAAGQILFGLIAIAVTAQYFVARRKEAF